MGKIVWLASYPKSGNTWMRFFLHAYFTLEHEEIDHIDLNSEKFARMFTQDISKQWFLPHLDKPWEQATAEDLAAVRMASQETMANQAPGLLFVKTHSALINTHGHPTINSGVTAGAIYMVRNPLDVVSSVQNHYGLQSLGAAIKFMNRDNYVQPRADTIATSPIRSWRRNVESWTGAVREGIFVVRYEDMLARPLDTFGSVIRFLGQKLDMERLKRAVELTSFDRLKKSEETAGFKETPSFSKVFFRAGKANQWRDVLSKWQVAEIVKANKPVMQRFGYLEGL